MIHGFLNNKIVSAEEYLIDLELRKGRSVGISHNLIDMFIRFDNREIDAFILDNTNDRLIIQLVLPLADKFDDRTNVYKNSHIRKLLNSTKFLSRFNKEFIKHIKPKIVHTENYTTKDKLWLLSHEEVCRDVDFLRRNNNCRPFDLCEQINLRIYSQALLKLNNQEWNGWWLRSACSSASNNSGSSLVGFVNSGGYVDYDYATDTDYAALLPACIIC